MENLMKTVVLAVFFAFMAGCHGGGNNSSSAPSLFPTNDNILTAGTSTTTVTMPDNTQIQAVGGQVLAEFKNTATRSDHNNLVSFLNQKGFSIIGQIPDVYLVQISVTSNDQINPLISDLMSLPYIQNAYPDMVIKSLKDPNPSTFTGSDWINDIQLRDTWNISVGKAETKIGIIDSGVDLSNVQFVKNSIKNLNAYHVWDGHGTAVTSVAVANGDDAAVNPFGVTANNMAGVCWKCSAVTYDDTRDYIVSRIPVISEVIKGISEEIRAGVKIINISQGGTLLPDIFFIWAQQKFRESLKNSVKLAYDKNVLLVLAAGDTKVSNDDNIFLTSNPEYENYWKSNVIVVTGSYRGLSGYVLIDNFTQGKIVDIAAPGVYIGVAASDYTVQQSDGTSFSAPMVAGVAGLIWSVNPNLSASNVKKIITDQNNTTTAANSTTIRILNAYKALADPRVMTNLRVRVINSSDKSRIAGAAVILGNPDGSMVTYGATNANGEITFSNRPDNATVTAAMGSVEPSFNMPVYALSAAYDVNVPFITLELAKWPPASLLGKANVSMSVPLTINGIQNSYLATPGNVLFLSGFPSSPYAADVYQKDIQSDRNISFVAMATDINKNPVAYGILIDQPFSDGMSASVSVNQTTFAPLAYTFSNMPVTSSASGMYASWGMSRKGAGKIGNEQFFQGPLPASVVLQTIPGYGGAFHYNITLFPTSTWGYAWNKTSATFSGQNIDFATFPMIPSNFSMAGQGTATPVFSWSNSDASADELVLGLSYNGQPAVYKYSLVAPVTRTSVSFPQLPDVLSVFRPTWISGFGVMNVDSSVATGYNGTDGVLMTNDRFVASGFPAEITVKCSTGGL